MGQSGLITLSTTTGHSATLSVDQASMLMATGEFEDIRLDILTDESILILQHYVRNLIKTISKVLAQVDQIKADTLIKETEKQLDQMHKKKKGGLLGLLMKIFMAIGVALGFIGALVTCNPTAIVLLAVTIAVAMDMYISEACGKDPLMMQAINALMKSLIGAMGEKLGAAMGAVILVIILVLSVVICRSASAATNTASKVAEVAKDTAKVAAEAGGAAEAAASNLGNLAKLQSALGDKMKEITTAIAESCDKMCAAVKELLSGKSLPYFIDLLEYTCFAAKSGVDIAGSVNQIDIAKLMKIVEDLSAEADFVANLCEQIKNGLKREYERLGQIDSTLGQLNPIHA
ncbi:type III secretion system translocon subunit SctE [Limnobacter humi]|uniref:Type III secretion system translocon subunit SctE n=1 Tax=Limnobacter humi TaxID=1778671 RepID=A0ABT1WDD6_9BURK|nr:type III secretion system translocon subunit SctE [Limnobacter humi]MCQ8895533.1 type III secretion system translocon subunit SctE [Limnobacter humi]